MLCDADTDADDDDAEQVPSEHGAIRHAAHGAVRAADTQLAAASAGPRGAACAAHVPSPKHEYVDRKSGLTEICLRVSGVESAYPCHGAGTCGPSWARRTRCTSWPSCARASSPTSRHRTPSRTRPKAWRPCGLPWTSSSRITPTRGAPKKATASRRRYHLWNTIIMIRTLD
eukprot:COSAG01_NODE_2803_length_7047_cov_19.196891_7_plen_172_part_00